MNQKIKYIIREVPDDQTEFDYYFEDDGLTSAGGDYCYNLFIVPQSGNYSGFNMDEYKKIYEEIKELIDVYVDIVCKTEDAQYPSISAMLLNYKLINNIHNTKRIKNFSLFLGKCCEKPGMPYSNYIDNFSAHTEEMVAKYLTLKTGKQWATDSVFGYCQGDHVKLIYCSEHYPSGVEHYGEVWLGAAKEFEIIDLDENGDEGDTYGSYIIADCQAKTDEDYKHLVSEWACIPEDETQLEMIDGRHTVVKYSYRAV